MKTPSGTDCGGEHRHNVMLPGHEFDTMEIGERRYTRCTHAVKGDTPTANYCGELIDVTDLPAVVVCCGNEANHKPWYDGPVAGY